MVWVSINTECHRTCLADVFAVLAPGAVPEKYTVISELHFWSILATFYRCKPECVTSVEVDFAVGITISTASGWHCCWFYSSQPSAKHPFSYCQLGADNVLLPGCAENARVCWWAIWVIVTDLLITLNYLDFLFSKVVMALSNIPCTSKMKSNMLQDSVKWGFFCFDNFVY